MGEFKVIYDTFVQHRDFKPQDQILRDFQNILYNLCRIFHQGSAEEFYNDNVLYDVQREIQGFCNQY